MTINSFKDKELATLSNQSLKGLGKLDVSNNLLQNLNGIGLCSGSLKWFNASHNQINNIEHIAECKLLNVLNLGINKISSLGGLKQLKRLNALILNNNDLKSLEGTEGLEELNTLVVSGNAIEVLDVSSLIKLQKLSASNNKLRTFPDLRGLKNIADLKLNKNKIDSLPKWLPKCVRLKVLDLGNNNIADFEDIELLGKLANLENLNLRGNPVCSNPEYVFKIKELLPSLKILDYKKLSDLYFKAIEERSEAGKEKEQKDESQKKKSSTDSSSIVNRGFKKSVKLNAVNVSTTDSDVNNDNKSPIQDGSSKLLKGNKERKKNKKDKMKSKNIDNDDDDFVSVATTDSAKLVTDKNSLSSNDEERTVKNDVHSAKGTKEISKGRKRKLEKEQEKSAKKSKKSKKDDKQDEGKKKKKDTGVVSITRIQKGTDKQKKRKHFIPANIEIGVGSAGSAW